MKPSKPCRILFITGTDTGVGKTLLTGLLLAHLRRGGCHALAIKPFCSGHRGDVNILRALQDKELTADELNPFFYPEPLAPLVSARRHRCVTPLEPVLEHIAQSAQRCDCLLVEGAGGLLVPLGQGSVVKPEAGRFTILELLSAFESEVIVVSRNKLGTLNHTLLTVQALQQASLAPRPFPAPLKVALMERRTRDASSESNARLMAELLGAVPLVSIPFLGSHCRNAHVVRRLAKKLQPKLSRLLAG